MPLTDEEQEAFRVWERELAAVCIRCPTANGRLSRGAYEAWSLLTKRQGQFGVVTELMLVEDVQLTFRQNRGRAARGQASMGLRLRHAVGLCFLTGAAVCGCVALAHAL